MQEIAFSYQVIRSSRKTVAIEVTAAGQVLVRCPRRLGQAQIRSFVSGKASWVQKHLDKIAARPQMSPLTSEELKVLSQQAKVLIGQRVAWFALRVGVTYGRITIRTQRSRWGSCSSKGNLSFNCLLLLTPPEVLDYVVVHELCHRKELNHSAAFWREVERILPEYRQHRLWLKENGPALIGRLGLEKEQI